MPVEPGNRMRRVAWALFYLVGLLWPLQCADEMDGWMGGWVDGFQ